MEKGIIIMSRLMLVLAFTLFMLSCGVDGAPYVS